MNDFTSDSCHLFLSTPMNKHDFYKNIIKSGKDFRIEVSDLARFAPGILFNISKYTPDLLDSYYNKNIISSELLDETLKPDVIYQKIEKETVVIPKETIENYLNVVDMNIEEHKKRMKTKLSFRLEFPDGKKKDVTSCSGDDYGVIIYEDKSAVAITTPWQLIDYGFAKLEQDGCEGSVYDLVEGDTSIFPFTTRLNITGTSYFVLSEHHNGVISKYADSIMSNKERVPTLWIEVDGQEICDSASSKYSIVRGKYSHYMEIPWSSGNEVLLLELNTKDHTIKSVFLVGKI